MSVRFTPPADLSPYEAFIFDCDGTLADTMPAHWEAWRFALAEGGANFEFTWDLFLSRAGMSMEGTVAELAEQFDCPLDKDIIAQRQREKFRELEGKIAAIPEVLAFAEQVAPRFPVAVASGSIRRNVKRALESIGASELFEIIVTPEDVEHGKPAPDMFLLAAEKMGVPPEKCLVLEDGALGIQAAEAAGMGVAIVDCPEPE